MTTTTTTATTPRTTTPTTTTTLTITAGGASRIGADRTKIRPWWRWVATALVFPPAGYLAHWLIGRVDAITPAVLAGAVTGAFVGVAQWSLLRRRGVSAMWIVATAVGFAAGLATGAALVDYGTSLPALAAMGAVCGGAIGLAQAAGTVALRRHAAAWTVASAALWAIGWAVTTAFGIDVEQQYAVFGISGALVVAFGQGVVLNRLIPATPAHEVIDHA